MRMLKMAIVAACALASTSVSARPVENGTAVATAKAATCYWRYSVITPDAQYDYYECYPNGDGSY